MRSRRLLTVLVTLACAALPSLAVAGCHSGDDVHVNSQPGDPDQSPVTGDDTGDK